MRRFFTRINLLTAIVCCTALFVVVKVERIDSNLNEMGVTGAKQFSPVGIVSEFPHNPSWDVASTPEHVAFVNVITQQPFKWLNKGYQACAFESLDGEYVVKFFFQKRLRERPFLEHPFKYMFSKKFRDKMAHQQAHREEIYISSKLAFEEFPEESGMLFVHLNTTQDVLRGMKIVDAHGMQHKIYPDETSFVVQRKAAYILPTITQLMKNNNTAAAKARLDQIFDLLLSLAKKGLVDSDYALIRNNNIGFTKDRAIYIDTGHITKQPHLDVRKQMDQEFRKRLKPLYEWLRFNYPELAQYYETRRHDILTSLSQDVTRTIAAKEAPGYQG